MSMKRFARGMGKAVKPEKMHENHILSYLTVHDRANEWVVMKIDCVGTFDTNKKTFRPKKGNQSNLFFTGISDILLCHQTLGFIAIEVKSEKGKLSTNQKQFKQAIEMVNGKALVVYGFDDFKSQFETLLIDAEEKEAPVPSYPTYL